MALERPHAAVTSSTAFFLPKNSPYLICVDRDKGLQANITCVAIQGQAKERSWRLNQTGCDSRLTLHFTIRLDGPNIQVYWGSSTERVRPIAESTLVLSCTRIILHIRWIVNLTPPAEQPNRCWASKQGHRLRWTRQTRH